MTVDLAVAAVGGVLQAFVAFVLFRHIRRRPSWGMNWLSWAYALGAFTNLFECFVLGDAAAVRVGSSFALDAASWVAVLTGVGSLISVVVGVRRYTAASRGRPRWEAVWTLLAFIAMVSVLRPFLGSPADGSAAAAICFSYMSLLLFAASRRTGGVGHGLAAVMFACYFVLALVAMIAGIAQNRVVLWTAVPFGLSGLGIMTAALERITADVEEQLAARRAAEAALAEANANLERRVAERTAELQDLVAGLESFNGMVSHDLRGPLGGIAGLAALAVRSAADAPPKVVRYLGLIRDEAARLAELVSSLLKLAGVSKAPLCLQYTDLTAVAEQAVETLRLQAADGRFPAIEVEVLPRLEVDAPLFQQVFVNLLSNAVKFTRDVAAPRVRVRASEQGRELVIEVSDNGAGFSAQSAASLFQPFHRLHGGAYEGTGLGLTIVRRIVERHGGRVWAEGRAGSGAMFFIALPSAPRHSG